MNIMLYSMITLYNSYIPLKLSFLGEARKGLLLTVSPAVSLLAPLLWGVLADRMTYRKRLLSALCILSSVFFLVICTNVSYPVLFSAILFSLPPTEACPTRSPWDIAINTVFPMAASG